MSNNSTYTWRGSCVCDLCQADLMQHEFLYDAKERISGMWAVMCENCFVVSGRGLGTGLGQKYQYNPETKLYHKVEG